MTTEQRQPGRELDALVAEKVMGWRVDFDSRRHWTELADISLDRLVFTEPNGIFHGEQSINDIPPYSTDVGTAWQVVERMKERGGCNVLTYPSGVVQCWINGEHHAVANTAPHAICLAALRAIGADQ